MIQLNGMGELFGSTLMKDIEETEKANKLAAKVTIVVKAFQAPLEVRVSHHIKPRTEGLETDASPRLTGQHTRDLPVDSPSKHPHTEDERLSNPSLPITHPQKTNC